MITNKTIYKLSEIIQIPFNKKTPAIKYGYDEGVDFQIF